jgi:hypothetical protein
MVKIMTRERKMYPVMKTRKIRMSDLILSP